MGCGGGGRFQTLDQTFKTGGFRIHGQSNLHVDPGPGALLLTYENNMSPFDLDCVIVTHTHTDHYIDMEVLVEAMARRKSGKPRLIGSESVLRGKGEFGPVLSKYHERMTSEIVCLVPADKYNLGNVKIEATPTKHRRFHRL